MKKFLSKTLIAVATPFLWIVGVILYIAVVLAKLFFYIYELLIPRGLRELVPILNLWRKYLLYISNLFSSPEKMELVKLEEEIEEVVMQEDRINKAYPIQRGVGETYDHVLIIVLIIAASVILIGSQNISFDVLIDTLISRSEWLSSLGPKATWIVITLIGIVCSTVMGMLSFVATIFGPIYAIFHRASLRLVKMGAYSWGSFYQRLENLFSLPYLASKASFSFFEAPPVDSSTYEEFKLDLVGDLTTLRDRFTNIR